MSPVKIRRGKRLESVWEKVDLKRNMKEVERNMQPYIVQTSNAYMLKKMCAIHLKDQGKEKMIIERYPNSHRDGYSS